MAWLRVLYTIMGAVIAFGVGSLLWPVRASEVLRQKIANILEGAGALYRAVTVAALQGIDNEQQVRDLDRRLHDLRRGITQQMDEARSELSFQRFNKSAYQRVVELADQVRRRLTAMAEDSSLYVHAQASQGMVSSMPLLAEKTAEHFAALAQAIRYRDTAVGSTELEAAVQALDADLAKLREQRATVPFALDRMLPFWALVFNLREVAQDLKELESTLPELRAGNA
jgi:DNA repair exonuclease SbcCD ATPase subunit